MKNSKMKQIKEEAEKVSEASIQYLKSFFRFVNPKGFLKKAAYFGVIFLFLSSLYSTHDSSEYLSAQVVETFKSEDDIYVESVKTKMEEKLVEEVRSIIERYAPTSELTPKKLVEKCLEYDMDIVFVLSQGLIESHFGTKGVATKTHSVWNVGAYDNQRPNRWYEHPDESIEPYLKLVTENYLIYITSKGDTIYKDLHHLVLKSYTNYEGKRFASAKGYENAMRKFMVQIDMETSISFYQNIIKMSKAEILVYFKPDNYEIDFNNFYANNNG